MRGTIAMLAILGAIGATGAGAARLTDAQQMEKALAGYEAGKEVDCITQFRSMNSTTFKQAIIYQGVGRTLYLNRFENGCDIGPNDIIVTRSYSSQVCRGDIIQIVDPVVRIPHGNCAFGKFVTYTKPKK